MTESHVVKRVPFALIEKADPLALLTAKQLIYQTTRGVRWTC
jgi:hypothetical protein